MKSTNHILVRIDPEYKELLNRYEVQSVANKILNELDKTGCEISLYFVGDARMRETNFSFRGCDKVTDVLSFTSNEVNPENGFLILGDIIISVPVALSQAEERQKPLTREINLLMIHGILHIIGYDHEDKNKKKKMFSLQKHLLAMVN
jgi:probable rRNA maturation factor